MGPAKTMLKSKKKYTAKPSFNKRKGAKHHKPGLKTAETVVYEFSHKINTCLGVALGYIDITLIDAPKDSQLYSDMKQAITGIEEAADLIKKMYSDIIRIKDCKKEV